MGQHIMFWVALGMDTMPAVKWIRAKSVENWRDTLTGREYFGN
jgi:hypothetical protein